MHNEAVQIDDTAIAVSALNTLDGLTSGQIDANSIQSMTGSTAELTAAYEANSATGLSGLGNEAVQINDETLGALALNDIWFGGQTVNPWLLEEGASGSSADGVMMTRATEAPFEARSAQTRSRSPKLPSTGTPRSACD